jgi:hypothetical protein
MTLAQARQQHGVPNPEIREHRDARPLCRKIAVWWLIVCVLHPSRPVGRHATSLAKASSVPGITATVLQLPAQPATAAEADAQKRVNYVADT